MNMLRRNLSAIFCLTLLFINLSTPSAQAATLVATGTNPAVCNQTVSSTTNITAVRSSQDCIITFTNTSEVIWTVPMGISSVSAIIVGGGGGGGDSAATRTGGGGGAGGFFQNSNIYVSGTIAIGVGSGGAGSASNTQGNTGGNSYIGTLKVGGGGGANGVSYLGGSAAKSGAGGADFVSSGSGGGARARFAGTGNEINGGSAGAISAGVDFLGFSYTGLQGGSGANAQGDQGSGGLGGKISLASSRTSSISGSSIEYSKTSDYRPWGDASSTSGTQTPGSGGSPNYGYGTDPSSSGGNGADGIVIIRYTISSAISTPTYSGEIVKGLSESVTVTANIPGKVRFLINGKRIPGCVGVVTTGTAPNLIATCTWKPSVRGTHYVHAVLTPTEVGISSKTSDRVVLFILGRSTLR